MQATQKTELRLREYETQAAGEMRVETVAREARAAMSVCALAAVIDRARELEHGGRQYGIVTMIEEADELRQGVIYLAGLYDGQGQRRTARGETAGS